MLCEECQLLRANLLCADCDELFCICCDQRFHNNNRRRMHFRSLICFYCGEIASTNCKTCKEKLCEDCYYEHKTHELETINPKRRVGVYWDLTTYKPPNRQEVALLIRNISETFEGVPIFIKVLGDIQGKILNSYLRDRIEPLSKNRTQDINLLCLDISKMGSQLTEILIISEKIHKLTEQMTFLREIHPRLNIHISQKYSPLQIYLFDIEIGSFRDPKRFISHEVMSELSCPELVDLFTVEIEVAKRSLVNILNEDANKGILLEPKKGIIKRLHEENISIDRIHEIIEAAEQNEEIIIHEIRFPDMSVVSFISLKISKFSTNILVQILKSLKKDEMIPTREAIKSKFTEISGIEVTNEEFNPMLLEATDFQRESFSFYTENVELFEVEVFSDSNRKESILVYPKNEKWEALDCVQNTEEFLWQKETEIWSDFVHFLERFFSIEGHESIPGGKYGCAFFMESKGSEKLRNSSLGNLSLLLHLAKLEGIIRYDKKRITWNRMEKFIDYEKRNVVKKTLVEILKVFESGIHLAEVPLNLNNSLEFPFNKEELGYEKLRDLVEDIPELVILNERDSPFVVLRENLEIHYRPVSAPVKKRSNKKKYKEAIEVALYDLNMFC